TIAQPKAPEPGQLVQRLRLPTGGAAEGNPIAGTEVGDRNPTAGRQHSVVGGALKLVFAVGSQHHRPGHAFRYAVGVVLYAHPAVAYRYPCIAGYALRVIARDELVPLCGNEAFTEVRGGGYLLHIWLRTIV